MLTNATNHFHGRVVVDGSDTCLLEELGAELSVTDAERELLLLRGFRGREIGSQEVFERWGHLGKTNSLDVLKSLLSGLEGVGANKLDHLGETLEVLGCLLDLGKATTCFIVVLLHKEEITLGGLVENEKLHYLTSKLKNIYNDRV